MRKALQRRASGDGTSATRKLEREDNPVVAAIIDRPIPSRAKVLLVALGVSAFESAVAENSEAVLVGFDLLRRTFPFSNRWAKTQV